MANQSIQTSKPKVQPLVQPTLEKRPVITPTGVAPVITAHAAIAHLTNIKNKFIGRQNALLVHREKVKVYREQQKAEKEKKDNEIKKNQEKRGNRIKELENNRKEEASKLKEEQQNAALLKAANE